jgi:NDP-sugar pyrophosphorylase family protein
MNAGGKISLRAGVLAAGRGERMRTQSGQLKPLVRVGDRTLIERVLNSMADAGATEVVVIINEDSVAVRDHVTASKWPFALRWIVETTPS